MNIKIVKATKVTYWYSRFIGSVFKVYQKRKKEGYFLVWHKSSNRYIAQPDDCEVTDEEPRVVSHFPVEFKCPCCESVIYIGE